MRRQTLQWFMFTQSTTDGVFAYIFPIGIVNWIAWNPGLVAPLWMILNLFHIHRPQTAQKGKTSAHISPLAKTRIFATITSLFIHLFSRTLLLVWHLSNVHLSMSTNLGSENWMKTTKIGIVFWDGWSNSPLSCWFLIFVPTLVSLLKRYSQKSARPLEYAQNG